MSELGGRERNPRERVELEMRKDLFEIAVFPRRQAELTIVRTILREILLNVKEQMVVHVYTQI